MSTDLHNNKDLSELLMGKARLSETKEKNVINPKISKIRNFINSALMFFAISAPSVSCVDEIQNEPSGIKSESKLDKMDEKVSIPLGVSFNETSIFIEGNTNSPIGIVINMLGENEVLLSQQGFICDNSCDQEILYPNGTKIAVISYQMEGAIVEERLDLEKMLQEPEFVDF